MSSKDFEPKPLHCIRSAEQTRAYVHHARMRIMGLLAARAMTASQVAKELGVHPANLTHHFKLLAGVRLIRLIERRDTGRVTEKYYRAIAKRFEVDIERHRVAGAHALSLSFLRDDLSEAMAEFKGDDSEELLCLLRNVRIDKQSYARFDAELRRLVDAFGSSENDDGETYTLSLALYPRRREYGPSGKLRLTASRKSARSALRSKP